MNAGVVLLKCRLYLSSVDLEAFMRTLNLGPDEHEDEHGHHEDGHGHHEDEHADHDHSGLRRRKRSSHEHHVGHEGNTTWDQVYIYIPKYRKRDLYAPVFRQVMNQNLIRT